MDVVFGDDELDRLEVDPRFTANLSQALVKAFRKKMQAIRAAPDERVFYSQRSFRFEELQGKRKGQYSMRLNDQYRLILEFVTITRGQSKTIKVVSIEDYH